LTIDADAEGDCAEILVADADDVDVAAEAEVSEEAGIEVDIDGPGRS
jgi:hypothetical protein